MPGRIAYHVDAWITWTGVAEVPSLLPGNGSQLLAGPHSSGGSTSTSKGPSSCLWLLSWGVSCPRRLLTSDRPLSRDGTVVELVGFRRSSVTVPTATKSTSAQLSEVGLGGGGNAHHGCAEGAGHSTVAGVETNAARLASTLVAACRDDGGRGCRFFQTALPGSIEHVSSCPPFTRPLPGRCFAAGAQVFGTSVELITDVAQPWVLTYLEDTPRGSRRSSGGQHGPGWRSSDAALETGASTTSSSPKSR